MLAALALAGGVAGVAVQQIILQPRLPVKLEDREKEQQDRTAGEDTEGASARPEDPLVHAAMQAAAAVQHDPVVAAAISQQQSSAAAAAAAAPGLQGPWVTDEEMELVIHKRVVTKNRLMAYINSMQQRMHQMAQEAQMMGKRGEAWFHDRMKEMEAAVDLQAQIILFGVDEPNARRKHLMKYGCSKWTDEALDVIKRFSPLIEIGAGHGHWQRALADKGVDVIAFDNKSSLPMEGLPNVGEVREGDETEIRKHRKRTLLLVYPGPDEMGTKCLKEYKGNTLLYVGESRGGVNGTSEFFDALERDWEVESITGLDPFPDGYEKLYVLRRKGQKGSSWWGKR